MSRCRIRGFMMEEKLKFTRTYNIELDSTTMHITSEGAVYKGIDMDTGKVYACKMIDTSTDFKSRVKRAKDEIAILEKLEKFDICVPQIFGSIEDKKNNKIWIVMEYIEGTTLEEKMSTNLPTVQFLNYMYELCGIVEVLEANRLNHKDIKPENIMIKKNYYTREEKLYLIDYDISLSVATRGEGSNNYRAPEMWNRSTNVNRKYVDQFSIGVIMYRFFTGEIPEKGKHYKINPMNNFEWKEYIEPKVINPHVSDAANDLIVRLMKCNPKDRLPNVRDLRERVKKLIKDERRNNRHG